MIRLLYLLALVPFTAAVAEPYEPRRAHFNYQLYCQGCHTPNGAGAEAVPQLRNEVGRFLGSREGREYLVRVPGASSSVLNDQELAEVMNWIVFNFAGDSLQQPFEPYSATEIGQVRQFPLTEIEQYREQVLANLADHQPNE